MEQSKKATAIRLYNEGYFVWQIASILHVTEAKIVAWLGF